jgi:hypothetical protein
MFTLDQVVPWGRSFDEYLRMFALSETDLARSIVGCGDGPASFNAESYQRGRHVVSCDPIYEFTRAEILHRIDDTYEQIVKQTRRNADEFVWDGDIHTVDELGHVRMAAMRIFLDDYEAGKAEGRYVAAQLPTLPFPDAAFDIALSSHVLFLYTSQLGESFHRAALREMCRVATDVRIFPLLALGGGRSPLVDVCTQDLRECGYVP